MDEVANQRLDFGLVCGRLLAGDGRVFIRCICHAVADFGLGRRDDVSHGDLMGILVRSLDSILLPAPTAARSWGQYAVVCSETFAFPGTIIMFLYFNGMNGVNSLSGLWMQIGFAACGSGLLAAIVGIMREG